MVKLDCDGGILLKRYKRFFADIQWQGQVITAHVPNTGSLQSCLFSGQKCYFSTSNDPNRTLKYTLEMVETPTGLVGVNTRWPNYLIGEAIKSNFLPHWVGEVKPEAKISKETRLDFLLTQKNNHKHYIEVKNVSLKIGENAAFPDAVTERGQKHLIELMELQKTGASAEIVFVIQRSDIKKFQAAEEIDPDYAKLLEKARLSGVQITPIMCKLTSSYIKLESVLADSSL